VNNDAFFIYSGGSQGAQITERDVDLYQEYMEEDKGELTRR